MASKAEKDNSGLLLWCLPRPVLAWAHHPGEELLLIPLPDQKRPSQWDWKAAQRLTSLLTEAPWTPWGEGQRCQVTTPCRGQTQEECELALTERKKECKIQARTWKTVIKVERLWNLPEFRISGLERWSKYTKKAQTLSTQGLGFTEERMSSR